MSLARIAVSERDRRFIIGRSGGCCNKCRTQVFVENEFTEQARLGDDAHIWAYSDDGPRGNETGAPANRNDRSNLILLCKNCHAEVDQQPKKFTPQVLSDLRDGHYKWVEDTLGSAPVHKPRFNYLIYLNLPRLDMYAVAHSMSLPAVGTLAGNSFADLGFAAGRVMAAYTQIVNIEDLYAQAVGADDDISGLTIGQFCFVESLRFRTVNIDRHQNTERAWESEESVIYRKFGDWKLICLIDPRWITTSTGGVILRSGAAQLSGVIRISRVDAGSGKIYASPLFLAQP